MKIKYKNTVEQTIFKTDHEQFPELIRYQNGIEVMWEIGFKCNGGYTLLRIKDEDYLDKFESMYLDYGESEIDSFNFLSDSFKDIIEFDFENNIYKFKI